ncbi:MAG: CRISPR-associated protein Cas2 [Clostridia bacterium]|nr:CRISPR-associated protein Cas2 [Clostridia bacterium]
MSCKLITYDLIAPNKDYSKLITAIKSYSFYAKITESCWIIKSDISCVDIVNNLKTFIDSNDKLIALELKGQAAWINIDTKVSEWLKSNLN